MTIPELTVAIGSYLEPEQVQRIAAQPSVRVAYEPDLLPVPRYPCDHTGRRRELSDASLQEWRELAASADVFFDFDWLEPQTMPQRCPDLRWIQATSAGIGAFMSRTGLSRSGLAVTLRERQEARHWERYATRQLAGLRALVVGLGGIGRAVAASLAALGVEMWGLGRDGGSYDVPGLARLITRSQLDAALPEIDVLVLACPLTDETEGMIGAGQIGLLKPDAIIINVSRGQLIDQAALTAALRAGRLGGACLDVFAAEPLPPGDPLWTLDNVIISPHSASTVATENATLVDLFIDNLGRFRAGSQLRNRYDPVRGY